MPRAKRILFENAWYHIMNRGAGRKVIFFNDDQRTYFLELLAKCVESFELEIHAYCLMANHFHLLVKTPSALLSDAMKFLAASYARKFNRDRKTDGSLFRGRFKAIVIDADNYLVQVSRYIHRNPVEAKLVEMPSQYPWSSFFAYQNLRAAPAWLKTQTVLAKFGASGNSDEYCHLVENGRLASMSGFYNSRRVPGVLGSKEFRHYVSGLGFPDVAPKAQSMGRVSLHAVDQVIASLYSLSPEAIRQPSKGRANPERLMAIFLSSKLSSGHVAEIAKHYGLKLSTLHVTLSQLRARAKSDNVFAGRLLNAEESIRSGSTS